MGDDRPAVYLEGNKIIYRASALGHCIRMLWAARSNMPRKPIPEPIKKAMDEGTDLEPVILEKLFTDHQWGYAYGGQQFAIELNVGAWNGYTLIVRGHIDERRDDDYPVDVKAFAQSGVDDYELHGLKDYYQWQQDVYGHGLDKDGFYMPVYNKDTGKMVESSLARKPLVHSRDDIRDRVLLVEEMFANGIMPAECPGDYACQYPYIHDGKDEGELPEGSDLFIRTRIKLSAKIKTLDTARKRLDEQIAKLIDQGVTYHLDGHTITLTANSNRFNTVEAKKLLREAGIDYENDPLFVIPGEGTKVTITPPRKPRAN